MRSLGMLCVVIGAVLSSDCAADAEEPDDEAETTHEVEGRDDGGVHKHTNRLVNETSPYLLQHAHNPVDWYPWGEAAFKAAREQDKPIFLSVGYSTCYWCHVMERESFEDEATAKVMNEHFICIKLDREERPDVDDIYMTAVQGVTGSGGWPMSVWLEPEGLKPFMAGTYFPAEPRYGKPSFTQICKQIAVAWEKTRKDVMRQADQIAGYVKQNFRPVEDVAPLDAATVDRAVQQVMGGYDEEHAGFGGGPQHAPKFPMPANLDLLIQAGWDNETVRNAVIHTLDRMATGGMYDQIGGGFHRYSTDRRWLVPHFEKMLYDNAQLASTYARAFELTGDSFYADIARETCEYVLREMTAAEGGFYSAQDAEVNAREGLNYLWTKQQIRDVLAESDLQSEADFVLKVYGFDDGPNFRDPHHPEDGEKNVVFLIDRPDRIAESLNETSEDFKARMKRIDKALLSQRDTREQPGLDDKILTGWNGLMIAGLADTGRILHEPRFTSAAERAAEFILNEMGSSEGGLFRTHRNGTTQIDAFLEDYAFFVQGLLALHEATGNDRWLREATRLTDEATERFADRAYGGFYDTRAGQSDLFVRVKSSYDGAVPSGNAVMTNNLITLSERTGDERFAIEARNALESMSAMMQHRGGASVLMVLALDRLLDSHAKLVTTIGKREDAKPSPGFGAGTPSASISARPRAVDFGDDHATRVILEISIPNGWHINANDPGPDFLIPLTATLADGRGISIEPLYPQGEPYEAAYAETPMRVHAKSLQLPILIRRDAAATDVASFDIAVHYQMCDDKTCLAPASTIITIHILQ